LARDAKFPFALIPFRELHDQTCHFAVFSGKLPLRRQK
jgi:hypothetical protein